MLPAVFVEAAAVAAVATVAVAEVVVILFPTEYKQWRTSYKGNNVTIRKPSTLMMSLLVVTREAEFLLLLYL